MKDLEKFIERRHALRERDEADDGRDPLKVITEEREEKKRRGNQWGWYLRRGSRS